MRILWLCNMATPKVAELFDITGSPSGGWVDTMFGQLNANDDCELSYVFISSVIKEKYRQIGMNFGVRAITKEKYLGEYASIFEEILKKVSPDLIHIWGTEYFHTYGMCVAAKKSNMLERVVISIQGLASLCAEHYFGNIPLRVKYFPSIRDIIRNDSLLQQCKRFKIRGYYEKKALEMVQHVIGRTEWDYACVKQINDKVQYHLNYETLRKEFYSDNWNYEECIPYTIFFSQSTYPLKGFHILLEAVGNIKFRFPKVKIYLTGQDIRKKKVYLRTSYDNYLIKLIQKYKLDDNIEYLGHLKADAIKEQYLKANVFVCASFIENSSNSIGEALALGVPVIASDVGGTKNFITHGTNGFLFPLDEPYMLGYYISKIFIDEIKSEKYGYNATWIKNNIYNTEKNFKQLIEIYEQIGRK